MIGPGKRRYGSVRMVVLVAAMAVVLAGCDWPMFGYGPEHTGFNPWEHVINAGNVSRLTTRFVGVNPEGSGMSSSPSVVNGRVYVSSEVFDVSEGFRKFVSAFSAIGTTGCSGTAPRTCAPLWSGVPGDVPSSPAVTDGVVYVSAVNRSAYGSVAAFDVRTGAAKWSVSPGSSPTPPSISNGVVYVSVGGIGGGLYALDAATGATKWTAPLGSSSSSVAVADSVVYVGSSDGKVYAFDATGTAGCGGIPKTCAPLWSALVGGTPTSPAIADGVMYVGSDNAKVYAFDAAGTTNCSGTPKTCAPLWAHAVSASVYISLAVANAVVYASSADGKLNALDARSGAGKWTASPGIWATPPAVANGVVYVGVSGADGKLYAFDASGTIGCSRTPKVCSPLVALSGGGGAAPPAVVDGLIYVGGPDGQLHVYGLP